MRGLREELGISVGPERLAGPLAPAHRRELHVPRRFRDCEFVETYRRALRPRANVAARQGASLEGEASRRCGCPARGVAGGRGLAPVWLPGKGRRWRATAGTLAGTSDRKAAVTRQRRVCSGRACTFTHHSSCRLDGWDGAVVADPGEVAAWRWAPLAAVADEVHQAPARFTAWFREEMALLNWLGADSCKSSRLVQL